MAVSKLPRPRHIPRNRISAEKPRRGARGCRGIPKFPGDAAAWWRGGGEVKKTGERAVARHIALGGRWIL